MSEPGPGDSDIPYSVSGMSDTLLSICRCVANHQFQVPTCQKSKSLSIMLCESALTYLHIVIWFSDMSEPENNCSGLTVATKCEVYCCFDVASHVCFCS